MTLAAFSGIARIVVDIEGTVCPVEFVTRTLLPYARDRMESWLEAHARDPEWRELRGPLRAAWQEERAPDCPPCPASDPAATHYAPFLKWLTDRDSKLAPLKAVQGRILEEAFERGAFSTPFFADVAPSLRRFREAGVRLAVYSSGSVAAQRMLFRYGGAGDLSDLFDGWFDTAIGPKRAAESYRRIAEQTALPARALLFVSDVAAELEAASAAGWQVCGVERPGNATAPVGPWPVVSTFDAVALAGP
jgi:enolase-phosphatase E1